MPLPPLSEQHRIVDTVDGIAMKIQAARTLRLQTDQETTSIIAAEEMAVWPEESLASARTLNDVTTFLARGRQTRQGASNHYLIKTQHVQMGRYVNSTITLSPEAAVKVNDSALARPGDILIACSAAGCLGRVALYSDGTRRSSTDSHVAIARASGNLISPQYLYAYLRGAQGQVQLRSREKGDWKREKVGFRLTELNVADMRKVPVPVPSPAEQRRIVDYVESVRAKVDGLKSLQGKMAAELDALLPAVLDRAFRGKL
jgi:type I restriction enzyme S subunit